jgi:translation initiation factor 1A
MPKNKGKGGKNRRRGKNENDGIKRELDLKEEGQEYAQVTKILGSARLRCNCFDGKERLCNIRGKMRRKVWIGVGDVVLLGLRDFQDEKADVIQKYKPDEARRLKAQGHIPDNIQLDEGGGNKEEESGVIFRLAGDEEVVGGEDGEPAPVDPLAVAPQQDYRALSDMDTTDSEEEESDEEEEDSDDDDEDEYDGYQQKDKFGLNKVKGGGYAKPSNKKQDFSIDNI